MHYSSSDRVTRCGSCWIISGTFPFTTRILLDKIRIYATTALHTIRYMYSAMNCTIGHDENHIISTFFSSQLASFITNYCSNFTTAFQALKLAFNWFLVEDFQNFEKMIHYEKNLLNSVSWNSIWERLCKEIWNILLLSFISIIQWAVYFSLENFLMKRQTLG